MTALRPLAFALLALAMFYVAWFARDGHLLTGLVAFALPPFLLGVAAWRGWHRTAFVAGVLALLRPLQALRAGVQTQQRLAFGGGNGGAGRRGAQGQRRRAQGSGEHAADGAMRARWASARCAGA